MRVFSTSALNVAGAQTPAAQAHENGHLAVIFRLGEAQPIALLQIRGQSAGREFAKGNNRVVCVLCQRRGQVAAARSRLLIVQPNQLANPQAARIEQFQDRAVAQILKRDRPAAFRPQGRFVFLKRKAASSAIAATKSTPPDCFSAADRGPGI